MSAIGSVLLALLAVVCGVVCLLLVTVLYLLATKPEVKFPREHVESLFRESALRRKLQREKEGQKPIAVVTGCTGGIGEATVKELHRLGFHVVLASRSLSKLQAVARDIQSSASPSCTGSLDFFPLDVGDLDSVVKFVEWYKSKFDYVNYIVNNAGTHYFEGGKLFDPNANTLSKQDYDEVFATNYLGHFLLTHLLLPIMKEGRVVNAASSYHLQSDSKLISIRDESGPKAANGHNATVAHKRLAYGVTKLTNVLHANQLHRVLSAQGRQEQVQAVSFCPGWVSTNMVPDGIFRKIVHAFSFSVETGILAPISDMLEPALKGGEFTCNLNPPMIPSWVYPLLDKIGCRYFFFDMYLLSMVFIEARRYGFSIARCSPEANNEKLAADLYNWTIAELTKKGYIKA